MAANDVPCCEPMFWTYLVICVGLVCFAGLMSGLTLGLMSLSLVDLEVLIKAGEPQDRKNAEKILPIVKNQHLLLCTLLICNALAMEALPIFLDSLLPAWGAILISVTLILAFGEIIPQAICSRYGLSVGAKLAVVVRLLVLIFFPLAYPISKLLDYILGKRHSTLLKRAELKTLVDMHGNEAGKGGELTHDETTIISGALDMTQKTAKDAMTPLSKIFSLDINAKLDERMIEMIMSKGHSRVPIYSGSPSNIIGLILVKNLIKSRPEDETPIRDLTIRKIPRVHDNLPLYDILNQFQKGHSHMAVVVKCKDEAETKTNIPKINASPVSIQRQAHSKGSGDVEQVSISIYSPSAYSSDNEIRSPNLRKGHYPRTKSSKREYQHENLSSTDLNSLMVSDKEVIGIITLEDVMEELLQAEIWDETDEYTAVQNKIKINMAATERSTSKSPVATVASYPRWQSPMASPLSPYNQHSPLSSLNHSPLLHSPILPYIRSPLIKPTLSESPGRSMLAVVTSNACLSPSSHRMSRDAYEKLRRPKE